ncbi:MAG: AAA family ATPase, partial [Chloroflexi bacterium]|nr:AAA family ATPase [Chloroflexota bacterium]
MAERLVSPQLAPTEAGFDVTLRPRSLQEFIGQEKIVENLRVFLEAARARGEPLDHVLLYGPPGLGKTTLASIIANEMEVRFQQTSGPVITIKGDLTAILTNVTERQ